MRQLTEASVIVANGTTLPQPLPPDSSSLEQPEPEHAYTASSVETKSEAAEIRRQRKFREGFAAYTAPPLLNKRSASQPAAVSVAPRFLCKPWLCAWEDCAPGTVSAAALVQCHIVSTTALC